MPPRKTGDAHNRSFIVTCAQFLRPPHPALRATFPSEGEGFHSAHVKAPLRLDSFPVAYKLNHPPDLRHALVKERVPQIVFAENRDQAQRHPQQRERQGNLSHEVEFQVRIVPNAQMHHAVDKHAGPELKECDDQRAEDDLRQNADMEAPIQPADQIEAQPAEQEHAPVRPAAPQKLRQAVEHSAQIEDHRLLPSGVRLGFHNDPSRKVKGSMPGKQLFQTNVYFFV